MIRSGRRATFLAVIALSVSSGLAWAEEDSALIERGRYLVVITGCNDCHTPAYPDKAGNVPEADWLVGIPLGFHGPWGTSYPINIRLLVNGMTEAEWIHQARTVEAKPPMPWFNLRRLTDSDLRAMYAFIRHLGPAGNEAPKALPPSVAPPPPFIKFPESRRASVTSAERFIE